MRTTPPAPRSQRRPARFGLIVGVLAGSLVFGGGAAWAYWSAAATATGTVSTTKVAITQANVPTLGVKYTNSNPRATQTLASTGWFSVKNESAEAAPISVALSASPATPATKLPVALWQTSASASCTPAAPAGSGAGSGTGTWASASATTATSVAAGTTTYFCVRTTVTDVTTLASTTGSVASTATLTATLTANGWTATDASGVSIQQTAKIFPITADYQPSNTSSWFWVSAASTATQCLDISGSGTSSGVSSTFYTCTQNDNQTFQIQPIAGSSPPAVSLRPMHVSGLGLNIAATTAATPTLQQVGANTSSALQRWYVQGIDTGGYQLVNAATGKCIVPSTSSLADCDSATTTLYLLRRPVTGTTSGTTLTLAMPVRNYNRNARFQYESLPGVWTNWGANLPASSNTISATLTPAPLMFAGNSYNVRMTMGSAGDVIWTGTVSYTASSLTLTAGGG